MDQLYAIDGYMESGYAVYTADAIVLTAGESTITAVVGILHDAEIEQLTLFDIGVSANLTLRPPAYLESDTQMSAQVNYTGAAQSTLDNIINLLLQGDRFRSTASALESAADISASLSTILEHTAQLPVEAVFVCTAERVKETDSEVESTFAVEVTGGKLIELGELYIDSEYFDQGYFEQEPTLAVWATLAAEADLVVEATRFTAEFTLEIEVDYIVEYAADLDCATEFAVTENIIRSTPVDLQADVQVQTEENVIRSTPVDFVSTTQVAADVNLIASADIEPSSQFAIIVVSEAIRYNSSDLQVTVALAATASTTKEFDASAQSESTVDVELTPIRNAQSDIECAADLAAELVQIKQFAVDITGAFSPSITADLVVRSQVYLESTVEISVLADKISGNAAIMTAQADVSAIGQLIATVSVDIVSTVAIEVEAQKIKLASADFESQFAALAIPDVFRSKWLDTGRPRNLGNSGSIPAQLTTDSRWGTGAVRLDSNSTGFIGARLQTASELNTYNIGANQDFVFETWIKFEGYNTQPFGEAPLITLTQRLQIVTQQSTIWFYYYDSTGTRRSIGNFFVNVMTPGWHHISISRSGSTLRSIRDGVEIDSVTYSGQLGANIFQTLNATWQFVNYNITENQTRVDSILLDGTSFRKNTSTVTGLTQQTPNDFNTTLFNYNWETDTTSDWLGLELAGESAQTVTATIQATPNVVFEGITIYQSSGTLECDVNKITPNAAELQVSSALEVEGSFVPIEFAADLVSVATQQTDAQRLRSVESAAIANTQLAATLNQIQSAQADLDLITQLSADYIVFEGANANCEMVVTVNTTLTATRQGECAATVESSVFVIATETQQLSADLTAITTLDADVRTINISQNVWIIEKETRSWSVDSESRAWNIQKETRSYTI